jgi:predicted TIM-barrel fold metal-dependent hydrolase
MPPLSASAGEHEISTPGQQPRLLATPARAIMKNWNRLCRGILLASGLSVAVCFWGQSPAALSQQQTSTEQILQSFAAIRPIDAHVHVFKTSPELQSFVRRLDLTLLNILVVDDTLSYRRQLAPQVADALRIVRSSQGHIALCTTFDPYKFGESNFAAETVSQLDQDFAQGAVAVKIWKNVGMEIKDRDGKFIMPDNPKFEPIYKDIAEQGKTLLTHLAEPDVAWGPPDPSDPSWSYYQEHPQWFLYNKPGFPSKQEILTARDHVLAGNPGLRVIGVHLGSMEKNLDNTAAHLDRYPNFAVDTAARMEYLMIAPAENVRTFLLKYQDRIVYGTDLDILPDADVHESLNEWQATYVRNWKFLATNQTFEWAGKKVRGLKLPEPVLQKIFRDNAIHWIPGIVAGPRSLK